VRVGIRYCGRDQCMVLGSNIRGRGLRSRSRVWFKGESLLSGSGLCLRLGLGVMSQVKARTCVLGQVSDRCGDSRVGSRVWYWDWVRYLKLVVGYQVGVKTRVRCWDPFQGGEV
ncbi:hypothetical protein HAX54_005748, partial [Datura stramonium]|nr:hypothetical protein [Datura stramonium]